MAIDIEETMSVKAPPKLVWNWLLNIENTIGALPGAKLESVSDDGRNFVARMKVKVGTVSLTYKGDLQLTEVDEVDVTNEGLAKVPSPLPIEAPRSSIANREHYNLISFFSLW